MRNMINPAKLEESFQDFTENFQKWLPDGIIEVDLKLLHELGLLNKEELSQDKEDNLMHYFHVLETPDKVTLFNEQFAIWIVPESKEDNPTTLTFIALLQKELPHLEIVFSTGGVYNTPKHILGVLQHFLSEVVDTEKLISSINKKKEGA